MMRVSDVEIVSGKGQRDLARVHSVILKGRSYDTE